MQIKEQIERGTSPTAPSTLSGSHPAQPLPHQNPNDDGHPSTAAQRFVCLGSRRGASLCRLTHFHNCVFAGREALTLFFFWVGSCDLSKRVGGWRVSSQRLRSFISPLTFFPYFFRLFLLHNPTVTAGVSVYAFVMESPSDF